MHMCECVCVCVCLYLCVCVREKETETDREREILGHVPRAGCVFWGALHATGFVGYNRYVA